jgi:hypothetical protein
MSENFQKNNEFYKKKYLKYKSKYLELKKNNDLKGGIGMGSIAKTALNFIKSNPNAAAGIVGSVASNVQNLPNLSSGISNMAFMAFETWLSQLPEYQQMVRSGLITPENKAIMFELIKLFVNHLADPSFYPIMFDIIKNVLILAGSAETLNPLMVISALTELYNILNIMKSKYPKDFILLSTFLRNNRNKIFNMISSRGFFGNQTLKLQFDMFMKLIEINPQQQMIN